MMLLEILILLSVSMVIWPMIYQCMGQIIRTNQELKKREVRIIEILNNAQKKPFNHHKDHQLNMYRADESMNIAYM